MRPLRADRRSPDHRHRPRSAGATQGRLRLPVRARGRQGAGRRAAAVHRLHPRHHAAQARRRAAATQRIRAAAGAGTRESRQLRRAPRPVRARLLLAAALPHSRHRCCRSRRGRSTALLERWVHPGDREKFDAGVPRAGIARERVRLRVLHRARRRHDAVPAPHRAGHARRAGQSAQAHRHDPRRVPTVARPRTRPGSCRNVSRISAACRRWARWPRASPTRSTSR